MNRVMHTKVAALSVEHPAELLIFRSCVVVLAALMAAYAYLVAATALNVIASKEASSRAAALEGEVGTLQQEYFALSQSVSDESIGAFGLTPVTHTAYVYEPSTVGLAGRADHAN